MIKLPKVLPEPKLPPNLPPTAKWLAGEGAGSWFVIEKKEDAKYKIARYSPIGNMECERIFNTEKEINLHKDFIITYPSHCSIVTFIQENEIITFRPIHSTKPIMPNLHQLQQ